MTNNEVRALSDHSAPAITAPQTSETVPTTLQGGRHRQDEIQRGTVASPRQDLALDFERQHRQYFHEALQQPPQSKWPSQEIKYESGEEYSIAQAPLVDGPPSQHEYNNDDLSSAWTTDSWTPSHLSPGNFNCRPSLPYHSDRFGPDTTMADIPTSSDLSAYAVTAADLKPEYHTTEPSYTHFAAGAGVYPYYQTSLDNAPNHNPTGPGGDNFLAFADEADHIMLSGCEGTMSPLEADLDPEDVEMSEDMKYDEMDSPSALDPSDDKELPYAKLIWKAFMSTPSRSMHLQQIYEWFRQNTDKANGDGTGWMNSIRHNLSMNKVKIFHGPPCCLRAAHNLVAFA